MNNNENAQIVISQEQLVDYLFHAATREDIATLKQEVKQDISKLDSKIDNLESRMDGKIDNLESRMDGKFDNLESRMDSKFDTAIAEFKRSNEAMEARIDRQFQKIDHRYNWIIGVTIGTGIAVSGLMIALVSFVIKLH